MSITRSKSKSQLVQTAFELQQETIIILICCRFVCGQRVGDWPLTLRVCNKLCPWFFAFGHTNCGCQYSCETFCDSRKSFSPPGVCA